MSADLLPHKLLSLLYNAGFILGWVYEARCPVCPFDEKFLPHCLLILIEHPNTQKCTPVKKNLKIQLHALLKLLSHYKNCTICEVRQSS